MGVWHTPELRGFCKEAVNVSLHLCGVPHAMVRRVYGIRRCSGVIYCVTGLCVFI